jgi:hypothetical protein
MRPLPAIRWAAVLIACALFSMSSSEVAHPEMLIRMAGLPFHRVGPQGVGKVILDGGLGGDTGVMGG